ncbi:MULTISPECIES: P-type conjugative transfer protein TrbL [unclassified Sphingomonas]|uniref:P-type conjugative transfer protein TrbL n=1 Tax=unclassified Sphingomonas TaxID=196159 RepID=UPI0009280E49|nr:MULTISPECIES: P-type conjugative transfer protein TrbL [unclassified Sphingomonas]OJU15158.1 MAG: P-type conjugative transfer protein TrbL [Sphingomonas sp. 66-10]
MNDLNVIDMFLQAFITYIDSGFGLLGGDVSFLSRTLIALDITLAGLFWALGGEDNVLGRLIRKILYIGAFAFILNSFSTLADIIFRSFAQAGLTAGGGGMAAADLLKPGRLAGTGFSAAWPLLEQASQMMGFTSFFDNFLTIMVLLIAWVLVILAFFILAVQMFVTILEFKLSSLAGFILVPFALWNRTSFLAERVLGHVVSSGIKVMVLAVIVGIGSNYFSQLTTALQGQEPDIGQALSLVLASLALFGLGIFGPGIASGLVSGAPQLGAGAALGTTLGAGGILVLGGAGAAGAARGLAAAGLGAVRAGTTMGSAAGTAYRLGQEASGSASVGAGMKGLATAASGAARSRMSAALGLGEAAEAGRQGAFNAMAGRTSPAAAGAADDARNMPGWARAMKDQASARHHRQAVVHAVGQGDRGGGGATPDIKERED